MTTEHHRQIASQYSPESGAVFYRSVMGDGMPVIHYGIYENEAMSMRQATENSTRQLLEIALRHGDSGMPQSILDLGAGPGGSAHWLAQHTGAHLTCAELCEHHNRENHAIAHNLGIGELIHTWTGSFEQLPDEWQERFDLVWSQEALCHAQDLAATLRGAYRALRPGGVMVFSDILLAAAAPAAAAEVFRKVNAVTHWSTAAEHSRALENAGFERIEHHDWTPHLCENFRRMRAKIASDQSRLIDAGVPAPLLEKFAASLDQRIAWEPGSVLEWGAFVCSRPQQ